MRGGRYRRASNHVVQLSESGPGLAQRGVRLAGQRRAHQSAERPVSGAHRSRAQRRVTAPPSATTPPPTTPPTRCWSARTAERGAPRTDVPLPPDASTTIPPPDGESFAGGFLTSCSCPSAGNCTTLGSYTRQAHRPRVSVGLDETRRDRGPPGPRLQLPAGCGDHGGLSRRRASPFMGFSGLSCPSAGNCTAVGGYVDSHGDFQGVIFTERDGTGRRDQGAGSGRRRPQHRCHGALNPLAVRLVRDARTTAPQSAGSTSVSGDSETQRGLLLAEHGGTWKASAISLPEGARRVRGRVSDLRVLPGRAATASQSATTPATGRRTG